MVNREIIIKSIDNAIIKCSSDGTTFSKEVSEQLEIFQQRYGDLTDHEELSLYDKNGNLLTHEVGEAHGVGVNLWEYGDNEDLHVFHNHPTLFTDSVPTFLSVPDMKSMMRNNLEGGRLLRSVTAVSPNGSRMTLIKTNDFKYSASVEDAIVNLNSKCIEYYETYSDRVVDYMVTKAVEYQSETGRTIRATEFRQEASEKVIKEMGTMQSFLKKNGVIDDLKSVNLKVKIKNGSGIDG